jgi:mannose-6-phosphate isomerase-like protein (cupin superfamily)
MYRTAHPVPYAKPDVDQAVLIGGSIGVIFRVLSDATEGSMSVVEHTLTPKALAAPLHRHQHEDEVSYVVEGQIAVLQRDEVTIVGPGGYIVKPRGIFHTFWNPGTEPARHVEVIAPGGFENYFLELAPLVPADAPPDIDGVLALARRYGLEFDMSSVPVLEQKYGVSLAGQPHPELG